MTDTPDHLRRKLLFAGLALGVVTPAQALNGRYAAGGVPPDAAEIDALLATGSLALQTSLVAVQTSPNPDVRAFAQSEIAEQRGIAAAITGAPRPAPLTPRGAAILAEAQSLPPGLTADRVYVRRQIEGHQQLHALARGYAAQGADPAIAEVARGSLPLIRTHLAILRRLTGQIG